MGKIFRSSSHICGNGYLHPEIPLELSSLQVYPPLELLKFVFFFLMSVYPPYVCHSASKYISCGSKNISYPKEGDEDMDWFSNRMKNRILMTTYL
ncbi:hypothetical protein HNY73_013483 [Argiope bruennichi]|uniref:Uncharacterized protein n=1 Tax=Argiope bruennichi TaxID=94029 RepID=A0A8T0F084_ARGBR|nr:hypothetical protein HNY73_013483 [Argiope bruennichi]